ncbi:DNA repair protein RAD50 [Paragonimus heterotremus]|uniref:DNA repair protein RAD50 n=1 Tax=Paragonimus heterotremus TaxID=100268 RepID=A0A8J4TFI6_9TREM|nr:DNA repair protein RAD50 [Paragonimus heterotremus]
MALVERMSILGIRSFDHETPQKIEFFTPVTLILGHNGTGKTTIIECLKYATTGDLPPGSKTGCSFIHDPRVARETEVKAKVTLQIRDVQGQPMVISRALVATQRDKNKQGTLKTLDGSIKRQLPDGRHTSISSKCAELDNEMVTSLGVSKAVLENVIFCHQEDSNWPLQEAKVVKQRFDDLFASSRYVKALDAIRKCKQEKDSNIRIYKTELKHLGKSREEANKLRNERQDLQQSIENEQRTLASVQQKLDPIVERLNLYKQKYAELVQIQSEISEFL